MLLITPKIVQATARGVEITRGSLTLDDVVLRLVNRSHRHAAAEGARPQIRILLLAAPKALQILLRLKVEEARAVEQLRAVPPAHSIEWLVAAALALALVYGLSLWICRCELFFLCSHSPRVSERAGFGRLK